MIARVLIAEDEPPARAKIVRVDAVVRYEPGARGDGILTLSDGTAVVLSRSFRREFSERFRGKR